MSAMRSLFATLFTSLCVGSFAQSQEALGELELRLEGPLTELSVSAGGAPTELLVGLGPGESQRVTVPVRVGPGGVASAVEASAPRERARPASDVLLPPPYTELPRRLRVRGLPPLERDLPTPGPARWTLLLATLVLALAARRYPWRALVVGALGASCLWLPMELPTEPSLVLLEGDGASGRWLEVRAARDELVLGPAGASWLRTLPEGAESTLTVDVSAASPAARVMAPGARVFALRELEQRPRLTLEDNDFADLDPVWVRSEDGRWARRGPWGVGRALPPDPAASTTAAGTAGLPGWLVAGLPQGVPVLVGRASGARWVRLVGP